MLALDELQAPGLALLTDVNRCGCRRRRRRCTLPLAPAGPGSNILPTKCVRLAPPALVPRTEQNLLVAVLTCKPTPSLLLQPRGNAVWRRSVPPPLCGGRHPAAPLSCTGSR